MRAGRHLAQAGVAIGTLGILTMAMLLGSCELVAPPRGAEPTGGSASSTTGASGTTTSSSSTSTGTTGTTSGSTTGSTTGCTPQCAGLACGAGDGCGGKCQQGICGSNATCVSGACQCQFTPCESSCCGSGQVCGSSGCCTPDCTGRQCGLDPVCGTACGQCSGTEGCNGLGQCGTALTEIMVAVASPADPNGDLGNLSGADTTCARGASDGGFTGTWEAMLCSSARSMGSLFSGATAGLPVVNTMHQPLYSNWSTIFSGSFGAQWPSGTNLYFFDGSSVSTGSAWLGCDANGNNADPAANCADWTDGGCGTSGSEALLAQRELSSSAGGCCAASNYIVCVRVAP